MIERAKTFILTVLVVASLIQSYLLAYSTPHFDETIPVDYVESKLEGTQAEIDNVIYPKDIVLHLDEGEHVVIYPRMIFYRMILDVVKQRTFEGLRVVEENSDAVRLGGKGNDGVEIRFSNEIPLSIIKQMMNVQGDTGAVTEPIDLIQIYARSERDEVRVFFHSSRKGIVYEATNADLTVKDVERFVGFGETGIRYALVKGRFYLPETPLPMMTYRYFYRQFTADQLQRSLFPDPLKTRNLREKDGSEIYTDGKRGLQLSTERQWMRYTDPAAPVEGRQDGWNSAISAIQFVNRHGGWNGEYRLSEMYQNEENARDQVIVFRHYSGTYPGAYPIINEAHGKPFGTIRLTLRNGVVTNYERSTIQIEGEPLSRIEASLPSGELVAEALELVPELASVKEVYPAYRPIIEESEIWLEPVWAVEMMDGSHQVLLEGGQD